MSIEQIKSLEKFIERGEMQLDALSEKRSEIDQISEDLAVSIERARIELCSIKASRRIPESSKVVFLSIE